MNLTDMMHYMILDNGAHINLSYICIRNCRIGMQRGIKLEEVFAKKRTNDPRYVMIKNAWDNVLRCCEEISEDMKANASKISLIQLILQHFCSANNKLTTIESSILQYKMFWIMIASCLRHYNDLIWKSDLAQCSITSIEKTL